MIWLIASAWAEPVELREALATALDANLDLRQAAARVDAADAGADLAVSGLVPTVTASGSTVQRFGPILVGGVPTPIEGGVPLVTTGTVRADVPLVDASGWFAVRSARLREAAAEADAGATEQAVLAAAGFAYVDLARAEQAVTEAEALLARSQRLAALAADRVAVGAAAPIEATRATLVARQDEQRQALARTERDSARLRLLEVLGLPLDGGIEVRIGPVTEAPGGAIERPDVEAAEAGAVAARADQRAASAGLVPSVAAFGEAGVVARGGDPAVPTGAVGVTATVPLFAGTGRDATVRQLRAVADEAELVAEDVEREAAIEVAVADANVRTGERSWALARDARGLSEQEVALAEDRFASGAASNVEVVEAQARLVQAVTAEVDALAAYNLALIDAWRARGRLAELAGR